jgi:hypothetical protein
MDVQAVLVVVLTTLEQVEQEQPIKVLQAAMAAVLQMLLQVVVAHQRLVKIREMQKVAATVETVLRHR